MLTLITDQFDIWTSAQTQKTNGAGRGRSSVYQSAHGIKKLRELILELAVRGKLVPQDPKDEPASELLKKIEAEKARLIKEGKIKKQEPLPEISEEEIPYKLPYAWVWTRLGTVSLINPRNEAEDDLQVSFVPMPLITTSHTGEHGQEDGIWRTIKQGYTHFANGDIGLAKITPCFENSKAVVFSNLKNGIGAGTTELHIARPVGKTLCARYILLYLKAPKFLLLGETKMTGTAGQKRVPKDFFAGNPLPLPPLAEQCRIVSKVDELMVLCDQLEQKQNDSNAAHQTLVETLLATLTSTANQDEFVEGWQRIANYFDILFTTEQSINQLKQTILQLAVMGKLVPQDPKDEPASELLKKIAGEKARLFKEGKIREQKSLPEIEKVGKPFGLPNGWGCEYLGNFVHLEMGQSPSSDYYNQEKIGIPFFQGKSDFGDLFPTPRYWCTQPTKYSYPGDILLSVRAPVGPTNVSDSECCIGRGLAALRPLSGTNTKYVLYFMRSFQRKLENLATGTTFAAVSKTDLETFLIAIPPLAEQHRIVDKVDELMALCDTLKASINKAQTTQVQLADAIVEQAVC
jgi:type I restriction enzyme S subunit